VVIPAPADDRAALVTGASSGIGEAIALELARRGHQLVLVARRTDRLHALAGSLSTKAHVLPADLSSRTDRAELPDRVAALGVAPDILINNAGLACRAHVAKSVPEQQLNLVEVDVASVVDLCSRFLPGMVERGRGAVLNVSSLAGFYPTPGQAAYGAAKAFVLSYTESLRSELRGVRDRSPPDWTTQPDSAWGNAQPCYPASCGSPPTRSHGRGSTVWPPTRPASSRVGPIGWPRRFVGLRRKSGCCHCSHAVP
jgi:NADP-dependent 3-hydroxy acid dehydrogenase YdfG